MIARTDTHLHLTCWRGRTVRVRRGHVKAFLAYAGAVLMIADATAALIMLHHFEPLAGTAGKMGAAMSGSTAFFDNLIRAAVKEAI